MKFTKTFTQNSVAIILTLLVVMCGFFDRLTAEIISIYSFVLGYLFSDQSKQEVKK